MNLFKRSIVACFALALLTQPCCATDLIWLDFTGWDPNLVTGGGQLFENIHGDTDVVVTGTPGNSRVSSYDAEGFIRTGGNNDMHSFTFSFTDPIDLVIDVQSIDMFEILTVTTPGGAPISYLHSEGAVPTVMGNLTMQGNGVRIVPDGAARGQLDLPIDTSFTWEYTALTPNKFERFRMGTPIPEPNALSMVSLAFLGMLRVLRRR